jgi:hypothetical protein
LEKRPQNGCSKDCFPIFYYGILKNPSTKIHKKLIAFKIYLRSKEDVGRYVRNHGKTYYEYLTFKDIHKGSKKAPY